MNSISVSGVRPVNAPLPRGWTTKKVNGPEGLKVEYRAPGGVVFSSRKEVDNYLNTAAGRNIGIALAADPRRGRSSEQEFQQVASMVQGIIEDKPNMYTQKQAWLGCVPGLLI